MTSINYKLADLKKAVKDHPAYKYIEFAPFHPIYMSAYLEGVAKPAPDSGLWMGFIDNDTCEVNTWFTGQNNVDLQLSILKELEVPFTITDED